MIVEPSGVMLLPTLLPLATTCRPLTGLLSCNGRGSGLVQVALEAGRICTGLPLLLVKVSECGRLVSERASAPKSISGTEGTMALAPVPVIGMTKVVSLSALTGLVTDNFAA